MPRLRNHGPRLRDRPELARRVGKRGRAASERGLALVEVGITMLVLAIALLGSVSWTLSAVNLASANREAGDATDVLRQVVEELQRVPVEEVYARFNADPADDPGGAGTAPGHRFTIDPRRTDAYLPPTDGTPPTLGTAVARRTPFDVELSFPEDAGGLLSESVSGPPWGSTGWDLNADGSLTAGDRSGDYKVLPVSIRVSWVSRGEANAVRVVRLLRKRR